jgi:formylglycine-generating enzyme required for sulfatase activity
MGSPKSEQDRFDDEGPQHEVKIARPFAVGRFAITRGEFAAFVQETNHAIGDTCYTRECRLATDERLGRSLPESWVRPG